MDHINEKIPHIFIHQPNKGENVLHYQSKKIKSSRKPKKNKRNQRKPKKTKEKQRKPKKNKENQRKTKKNKIK